MDNYLTTTKLVEQTGIPRKTLHLILAELLAAGTEGVIKPGREFFVSPELAAELEAQEGARHFDPARAKAIREAAGISYRDAADEVGVSWETLRRWETGDHKPLRELSLIYQERLREWERLAGKQQVAAEIERDRQIRELWQTGEYSEYQLAQRFHVSRQRVSNLVEYKSPRQRHDQLQEDIS
jgi:DNA-binding XRE family transcriptional regulator